jgi:Leucine-rich repeat (LRR) protein
MEIKCKFGGLIWSRTNVSYYGCEVKEASITEPGTEIKGFDGEHQQGKTNFDVENLWFNNTSVEHFPRGLSKIFPNLKVLDIKNCGLKKISRNNLKGLEDLEVICIRSNNLRSLPSDLFKGMTNLKDIFLCGNKLEFLSSKLLEPIAGNQLGRVKLGNSKKINAFCQPGVEGSVASLQELMKIIDKNCERPEEDIEKEEIAKTFAAGFEELWTSKDFADFTIIGGFDGSSEEFAVHKNVLAMQSSVLNAVFKNNMKEAQTGKMTIEDFSVDAVEGMFKFMYTGEVNENIAMDLYAIASKYDVKNLKSRTEKIILQSIDNSNALEVFGLGHQYNSEPLIREAFDEIQKMFSETPLKESLMNKPGNVKHLVEAHRCRQRKVEEAERKYQAKWEKFTQE